MKTRVKVKDATEGKYYSLADVGDLIKIDQHLIMEYVRTAKMPVSLMVGKTVFTQKQAQQIQNYFQMRNKVNIVGSETGRFYNTNNITEKERG